MPVVYTLAMNITVKRREAELLGNNWALVYGRRKVGKTFMLRRFQSWDYFVLVSRDGNIWIDGADVERFTNIDDFLSFLLKALRERKRVVIDEFQRLPDYILEKAATMHPSGTLILSGSSMRVVKEILGGRSPLLGLLEEHPIGLINARDMAESLDIKNFLDYTIYARDPWLIPLLSGKSIYEDLYRVMAHAQSTIPSLIGEIFREEERVLTSTYEGVIECIGSGHGKPSEIASILYSRGRIPKDSASAVVPYIKNLIKMGILKELELYGSRKKVYRMVSPIFSVFYFLSDKYEMEFNLPSFDAMKDNIMRVHGLCYEDFVVETIARIMGGSLRYSLEPEIDGIIVDRKGRPMATVEVKHGNITKSEVSGFVDKTENIRGKRIVVARNKIEYEDVRSITPEEFRNAILRWELAE